MLAKIMSWFLLGLIRVLTGAQARWYGSPPKAEQRIYFANHQSHADLVMIWAALPLELRSITRPIAAKDYWTSSPFKQWITTSVFNAIYVDRARTGDQDPLEPLIDALTNGDSIILFPEGTRGNAEEPQSFWQRGPHQHQAGMALVVGKINTLFGFGRAALPARLR
ncbi:MAG: 1-acyl-sn-glycerol-3-phosphate acyltransferase, partial [Burkholderiaceae bacterium]|nr:1-acyl-sn-glycerol-3-phosphate acyltransferase [Burkholderiaceae bacterium]